MRRIVCAMMIALAIGAIASHAPVAAQDATPIAPDPALCTLTPPTYEEVSNYAASPAAEIPASPEATPAVVLPAGEPVDEATRDAVEQSMIVNVACLNSGSTLLTMAAYSDEALGQLIGGAGPVSQEFYDSLGTPVAIPENERTVIIEFQEMVMLPDGRIAAIVLGDNPANAEPAGTTLFYLVEQDGHWYIDDFINP